MSTGIVLLNESGLWLVTQLGRMSVELAILAGIVLIVLYVLRVKSPSLRHLFWGLLLAKPVVTFLVASPLSLYGFLWPTMPEVFYPPVPVPVQMESTPFEPPVQTAFVPEAPLVEPPRPETPSFWRQIDRYGLISALWALMASLFGLRLLLGCAYVSFLRSTAQTQREGPLAELVAEAERPLRMRRRVRIATTRVAHGPVLAGIFRPVILLPEHMAAALSPRQMKLVITHELAHARRWDNLVLLIQRLAEMFFFFHPVVWFCGWMMRREAEAACDDMVVAAYGDAEGAGAAAYADSLTRVAEMKCGITHRLLVNTFAAAESNFHRRIRRILSGHRTRMTLWLSLATGFALVLIGVLGLPTVSSTSSDPLSSPLVSATPMLTETSTGWREDFENYTSGKGAWPDTWIADGNASDHDVCYVDGSTFSSSHGNVLRLHGDTPAWSPLAYFVTTMNMPFQITFDVYLESPNPNCTCVVGLREKPDWRSPGVLLLDAPLSSEVKGLEPVDDGGVVSQGQSTGQLHLEQAQWYHVELTLQEKQGRQILAITLSTSTNVQGPVQFSVDTNLVKDMPYLQLEVRSGTAWFDNVSMAPVRSAQAESFGSGPLIIAPLVGYLDDKIKAEWRAQGIASDMAIFEKLQDVTLEAIRKRLDNASLQKVSLKKMANGRITIDLPPGKEGERIAQIVLQPGQVSFCAAASKDKTLEMLRNAEKDPRFRGRIEPLIEPEAPGDCVCVKSDQCDAAWDLLQELNSILPRNESFMLGSRINPNALYLIDFDTPMQAVKARSAKALPDEDNPGRSKILLLLTDEDGQRFGDMTQSLIGSGLAILVNREIQSVPIVRSKITDGVQIVGNFTHDEAADLAACIANPEYPAPLCTLVADPGAAESLTERSYENVNEAILIRLKDLILPVYDPSTGEELSKISLEPDKSRLTLYNFPSHLYLFELNLNQIGLLNNIRTPGAYSSGKTPKTNSSPAYTTREGGYTHLVIFEPAGEFNPQTPHELLDVFNDACRVRTGYFRTKAQDGRLVGSICTDDPDRLEEELRAEPRLKWVNAEPLTSDLFEEHEARAQESLAPEHDYTHLVTFEPAEAFNPQTPRELLEVFNGACNVRTGYFRAKVQEGRLVGSICTDDPDRLQEELRAEPRLTRVNAEPLTPDLLKEHQGRTQESLPPGSNYTHLVTFESAGTFNPQTPEELLDVFNGACKVKTGYFRTKMQNGRLVGSICTDAPEEIRKSFETEPRLKFVESVPLTTELFAQHVASEQESLPVSEAANAAPDDASAR